MQRRPFFKALILAGALLGATALQTAQAQAADPAPADEPAPEPAPDPEDAPPTVAAAINLLTLVMAVDENAQLTGNGATFTVDDTVVTLVFDVNADRMRLFSQIGAADGLTGPQLRRLMQANFDTALDARYAIAQGEVWSTFIHPLTSLNRDHFVSAIAQTVTLAKTYGTTFTSGALSFGGGDSNAEIQRLLERLLDGEQEI